MCLESWLKGGYLKFCCCFSVTKSCLTLCDPMDCSTPGFPVLHCLLEFAQTHVHWISDAIQPFHPLSTPSLPALNLSRHWGLFQWVGSLHQMAKVLELQLNISPSKEYSGLISFRIDWFELLAVQGTLKSHLQDHSLKASVFQCSILFLVPLSHSYMTTGKTIHSLDYTDLCRQSDASAFNMLSRCVIAFLPRSKHL